MSDRNGSSSGSERFGDLVKRRREELGKSHEELANDLVQDQASGKVSPEYLRAIERNQIFPSPGATDLIAKALGMDSTELRKVIAEQQSAQANRSDTPLTDKTGDDDSVSDEEKE